MGSERHVAREHRAAARPQSWPWPARWSCFFRPIPGPFLQGTSPMTMAGAALTVAWLTAAFAGRLETEAADDDPAKTGPLSPPTVLRVTEITLHGDLDCFKIETPTAAYVYGK